MASLVTAINDHVTEFYLNLTFLSPATLLKNWINPSFSDIALTQRFKYGTAGCKYNKDIYLNYIPKHPFRGKLFQNIEDM